MSLPTNLSKPNTLIAGTDALAADINGNLDYIITAQNASNTQTNTNTDEIVTARNGAASLDARLDAADIDRNLKAYANNAALTGVSTAPTAAVDTNTTQLATTAFVQTAAFKAALPAQTGNAGKFVTTDGTSASWATIVIPPQIPPSIVRSARTSNTMLGVADSTKLIDITSGTFTQTFDAAATLGNGWYCYIRNAGTGDITLDPNGAETIDGAVSAVIRPKMMLLVVCSGAAFYAQRINGPVITEVLTSGTSWVCPAGVFKARLKGVGGGSSGPKYSTSTLSASGAGGGYFEKTINVSPGVAYAYSIGTGGASVTVAGNNGNNGGATTFNDGTTTYTANGGVAGSTLYAISVGGTALNGDVNIKGGSGIGGTISEGGALSGSTPLSTSAVILGESGHGYGGGGAAGCDPINSGAGADGVIILEY